MISCTVLHALIPFGLLQWSFRRAKWWRAIQGVFICRFRVALLSSSSVWGSPSEQCCTAEWRSSQGLKILKDSKGITLSKSLRTKRGKEDINMKNPAMRANREYQRRRWKETKTSLSHLASVGTGSWSQLEPVEALRRLRNSGKCSGFLRMFKEF